MIYQVVSEKVNHFQELKEVLKMLKTDTFSFRPQDSAKDKYVFRCFKDRLPQGFPLLKEEEGITLEENGKTVKIYGDPQIIVNYFKKTKDLTLCKLEFEG